MGRIKNKVASFKGGIIGRLYHNLLWIYSFYRNFIGRIVGCVVVELIQMAVEFYISYRIGSVVDYAVEKNTEKLLMMGVLYVGLIILNALMSIVANRFEAWNYNSMRMDMVKALYNKIVKADWEELTSFHTGDLIQRITNDARVIAQNANLILTKIIVNTLVIIASLTVIILNDASMILVVIVVAPIIMLSSRIFMSKVYECQSAIRTIESKESAYHKESFHNIQAVKAFGLAREFYERIKDLEQQRYKADMKSNFFSLMSWGVTYLGGILSGIACVSWAFYRVDSGAMTLGALTVVIMMAYRIATSGKIILGLIPTSLELTVSAERIREILSIPDEEFVISPEFESFDKEARKNGVSIKINDMSFAYKTSKTIFNNVSLEAHPGEIIALVGPSGEGKTTMLRILLGILNVQKGDVYAFAGENNKKNLRLSTETRPLIAYVPQGNTMLSGTIEENMRLIAPEATEEEIIDALKQACAYDFVKKLPDGIYHNIGEGGTGFSEGQNQRLAIARAILRHTPILLMDEATSALDVATERQVLKNIMKKDINRTCILTTHRPSVLTTCDRVYRISNGNVSVIGNDDIQKLINEF
ncbi:ABC transporter ATP-binding protein [Butyrivibrio sp. VCB2001]|uniref:ABC transporter ATP-binding protein n=1 Tax=Butyrivibrio sp. VCB2001 TaxID=1280667 RepID=UPI0003FD809D|nr:ABC transporter ATP-binding protein [Butyrivibrio sp. VCB2001]